MLFLLIILISLFYFQFILLLFFFLSIQIFFNVKKINCSMQILNQFRKIIGVIVKQMHCIFNLQYNFFMITQNYNYGQQSHFTYEKQKALTPATADSLISQQISQELTLQDSLTNEKKIVENNLFRILEEKFEVNIEQKETIPVLEKQHKIICEENIEQCDIRIGVSILRENSDHIKTFVKDIIKSIETQDSITLIFDKQYEKVKLQENCKYELEIFAQSSDNFSKVIWRKQYQIPKSSKKWSVVTLSSKQRKQEETSLNIQLEKIGSFFLKFLSIKLPRNKIDQFYDFKRKLLNKSDILSQIKFISELKGILLQLCKQNMGSRIIQKLLTWATQDQLEQVISQLKPYFVSIILDRYGNYVFQKIFKMANNQQKNICLQTLSNDLIYLLKSKQGTHCIQSLVQEMEQEQAEKLFLSFSTEQIVDMSTNQFSVHFIKKILSLMRCFKIHHTCLDNYKVLCEDKYGVTVIKTILEQIYFLSFYPTMEILTLRNKFLYECQNSFHQIVFSQYGHYIVHQMLGVYNQQQLINIINFTQCYVAEFGKSKFSSSIVKKMMQTYGDRFTIPIIHQILANGLQELMQIPSGQFILHRILQMVKNQGQKNKLLHEMKRLTPGLKNYQKKNKWKKFFKIN